MDGRTIATELYGLPREEFTAARNARVRTLKADGLGELVAEVQGLRKPTVGAWLLNRLVRRHPDEVERLLDLGARLRAAQGTLGADELRALGEQRRQLTRAVAGQAASLGGDAGRAVSPQVLADIEETLRSAMVDADAGAALSTGLLVDTFSSTGLEPVDLSRVVAGGGGGGELGGSVGARARTPRDESGSGAGGAAGRRAEADAQAAAAEAAAVAAAAEARRALEEAEETARAAAEECAQARRHAVEAGRRREDLQSELDGLRRQAKELERRVDAATDVEDAARREQIAATRAERAAVEAVARVRRRLQALTGEAG